jgi:hypothetical protein
MQIGDVVMYNYCSREAEELHAQEVADYNAWQMASAMRSPNTPKKPERTPPLTPVSQSLPAIVAGFYDDDADMLDLTVLQRDGHPFAVQGVKRPDWRERDKRDEQPASSPVPSSSAPAATNP